MAKSRIEKAPINFDINELPSMMSTLQSEAYLMEYFSETDSKGRYLYWDQFKWRVPKGHDVQKAWLVTKWVRFTKRKPIALCDAKETEFHFCIPDSLQAKLYKIAKLSGEGTPTNSIQQKYLISSLVMEEAISSAQLEGASTTRRVAKKMLVDERQPKSEDEQMILNNYLLMNEVKSLKDAPLSLEMIQHFHKIATEGTTQNGVIPGAFRIDDEIVIADGVDGEVLHQPPSHTKISKRLEQLCTFANTNHSGDEGESFIDPIVKAIILHFMIGYEHPFADGNGRTARAIFYWFMLKNGFSFFEYLSISKLLKEAPIQYGMAYLYTEIDDNDLTYFIYYQADIILRAMDELFGYLDAKSRELEEVLVLLEDSKVGEALNFIQKDIVKKAMKNPGRIFTVKEIANNYDISENTARKYLKALVKHKILATFKEVRTINYIALANIREVLERQ
ncbi:MAG: Fic family protein [Epsilonproteobacteria bacterium]|nr:Fic family protein [Campylobacterota bacterium]